MAIRRLILVTGGARSGKSTYAEQLALQIAGDSPILFVATATADDAEMSARIANHQASRPSHWITLESAIDPGSAILLHPLAKTTPVIIIDCLTLLTTNLLLRALGGAEDDATVDMSAIEQQIMPAIERLLTAYTMLDATMILVTNEVGMGIVPAYPLGRIYRDLLGRVNATVAKASDIVLLMVAGLPVNITKLNQQWQQQLTDLLK